MIRLALDPVLGERQPFMTYLGAVILAAWLTSLGPSMLVYLAALPIATWLFINPRHQFWVTGTANQIAVATYLVLGLTVIALGAQFWRARREAEQTEAQCDFQVRELDQDRQRLNDELNRLTVALQGVDRRREEFLGILADELRRPLVPIASAASFHSIAATASEMESAMDTVKQEAAQLGRLLDDLVDAFRSKDIQLRRQRLDLTGLVNHVLAAGRSVAAQSGRELTLSLSKDPVWVDGDAARLERVVSSLLRNAIRSTNPGGQIWVTVQGHTGDAVLKVRHTGMGLPPAALPHILHLDGPLNHPLPQERSGLCIALAAIKPIVEWHGGTVTINDQSEQEGCEFVIRLPLVGAASGTTATSV